MAKKKKLKNKNLARRGKKTIKNKKKNRTEKSKISEYFVLPKEIKKWILGIVIFILSIIIVLSFFDLAGIAGETLRRVFESLIGKTIFIIPFLLVLGGLVFFQTKHEKFLGPVILAIFFSIIGIAGILETLNIQGGSLGYLISLPFLQFFGSLVTQIIFIGIILIGFLIFWHLLNPVSFFKKKIKTEQEEEKEKKSLVIRANKETSSLLSKVIGKSKLNVEKKENLIVKNKTKEVFSDLKIKAIGHTGGEYKIPSLDLLVQDKGKPSAGDTMTNSIIIKKTLETFGLNVEMSEINIGPTVTQYTLKPAEGIKLSKITALSNNLSLALASHPIRIEAPIPGKSLVGIEIPNKERCYVRIKDLIANSDFQRFDSGLPFVLGRDVSNNPCYADLSKMPHLLIAGSTGTGKTIFLNNFILSLLYRNSPENLKLILVDPKRVEFSAYQELPHLLCPVIFDPQKTINALKWLVLEMERRFDILSGNGSRNILSYNEKVLKQKREPIPYIVLIIDELADLMVDRGKEMETGIVRLAQMARAVGIHLVIATQRPSVEVITGLIKANISSRVAFQVASQVDSRTILDMAGAEKLLGAGDFLFTSATVTKPKRIQGSYVTEKEVKKVVDYIKTENQKQEKQDTEEESIAQAKRSGEDEQSSSLEKHLMGGEIENILDGVGVEHGKEEDPLYEEAKQTIVISKKASASLLQRRLKIGYARAARLIDMLEQRGVVGPGQGAKPREVYIQDDIKTDEDEEGWQKV